jgi:hypothetical protein
LQNITNERGYPVGRTKGSKNQNSATPSFFHLSAEERLELLANLMIDKIMEDQTSDKSLLHKIEEAKPCTTGTQVEMPL